MRSLTAAGAGCALLLTACRGPEAVQDLLAQVPELERREVVRIGGLDDRPEHALSRVEDAALLGRGRVAVADGASQQIRIYDLAGSYFGFLGGEGNGPGEFRAIRRLAVLPAGEVLAWDVQRRRVTVFDTAGTIIRSFVVDIAPLGGLVPRFVGAFADGGVAVRADVSEMGLRDAPAGVRRDSVGIGRFDPTGALVGGGLRFPGPERDLFNADGYWGLEEPLFARNLVHAVVGDALFVGHTDSIHLRRLVDGRETGALRIERPSQVASSDHVRSERQRRIDALQASIQVPDDRLAAPDLQRAVFQYELSRLEGLRALETLPAFADLMASDDGRLWLKDRERYTTGTVAWYRLDAAGEPLGRITLPASETLLSVTDRHIVTLTSDALDVETVVVYEIHGIGER